MQFQAGSAKADTLQPALHDLKCREFFGHKQNAPPIQHSLSDYIADGLAFAGAGRALDHNMPTTPDSFRRQRLAAIHIHHMIKPFHRDFGIHIGVISKDRRDGEHLSAHQRAHHGVIGKARIFLGAKVTPHEEFGERKKPNRQRIRIHAPMLTLGHQSCDAFRPAGGGIGIGIEIRQCGLEIHLEHFAERKVLRDIANRAAQLEIL